MSPSPTGSAQKYYITKNEVRKILEEINTAEIRQDVFRLYGFKEDEYEQRVLLKAYYTYMSDR